MDTTTQTIKRAAAMGVLAFGAAVLALPSAAADVGSRTGSTAPSLDDRTAARTLAQSLCLQLRTMPRNTSAEQVEAALLTSLSQRTDPLTIQLLALDQVAGTCATGEAFASAVGRARVALGRGGDGTNALTAVRGIYTHNGSGAANPSSAFASPSVQVGGGSVNYSNTGSR